MNYLVYLHSLWLTHKQLHKIFKNSKDYRYVYENISFNFLKDFWVKDSSIENILQQKQEIDLKKIDNKLKDLNIKIINFDDENYPKNLKNISNPPYLIYVRWELNWEENFFSIVWSRKMSQYAKKVGESIIPKLLEYFTIVSGWAWWCDSLAHKIAIDNDKKTIVVFGTWIDVIYPSWNKKLFEDILLKNWVLMSIFSLWTLGNTYTFPIRNEIVSGISCWVLLLEAWEKSWTLITAKLALDQWRDVFAIPWDVFMPNYIWVNNLIKSSQAKLITKAEDILEEYGYKIIEEKKQIKFLNDIEKEIFDLLKYNLSLTIDDFLEKSPYNYGQLSLNLSIMEIRWVIKKNLFWSYEILP